jgi:hypothetical protein
MKGVLREFVCVGPAEDEIGNPGEGVVRGKSLASGDEHVWMSDD